jgi:hypothetical protein
VQQLTDGDVGIHRRRIEYNARDRDGRA